MKSSKKDVMKIRWDPRCGLHNLVIVNKRMLKDFVFFVTSLLCVRC
jgi:hypothetical protein